MDSSLKDAQDQRDRGGRERAFQYVLKVLTFIFHDVLMSGFAMMALKDPSMLAFERRRIAGEHNLRSVFHIKDIACDTQMCTRLDVIDPYWLRPAY